MLISLQYSTSTRPDQSKRFGFFGGKFPLPYGPGDGDAGMRMNIERIKASAAGSILTLKRIVNRFFLDESGLRIRNILESRR